MTEIKMDYQRALDYLDGLTDYSLMRNLHYSADKFDLSRMIALMEKIDNPQKQYPVFHVAGTKGKGSTSALIASGLMAAGYRVGLYTSPHLLEYTERIQVNGVQISRQRLAELVIRLRPIAEQIGSISKFELTTAAAYAYFAEEGVDAAVIEVGLGGRLDATNVVTPMLSVITSLSYDHMNVLGHTLTEIAREKAGIIKPGRPVIVSPQREEALQEVVNIAGEKNSEITLVGKEILFSGVRHSLEGQSLWVWHRDDQPDFDRFVEGEETNWAPLELEIPLLGYHQLQNTATAYAALWTADRIGMKVNFDAIRKGFANTSWPGRFEILHRRPFVILDSAHNRDSALRLRHTIDDYFPENRVVMLFGVSEDKDVSGMFEEILPRISQTVMTQSATQRAMSSQKLVDLCHRFGKPAQNDINVKNALDKALSFCDENTVLLITGSMFLVAEARRAWDELNEEGRI